MNAEQQFRQQVLTKVEPMTEDATWRAVDPRDRHRIACDRVGMCGSDAIWATRQGGVYVCDYHRFILEVERILHTVANSRPGVAA